VTSTARTPDAAAAQRLGSPLEVRPRRARRLAPLAAALPLALASVPAGGQETAPPCPPADAAKPVFASADFPGGGHTLFATHPVTLGVGFPSSGPSATLTGFNAPDLTPVDGELNVPPFASFDGDVVTITLRGDRPGTYPETATWSQNDAAGHECAGSASASVTLAPVTPPHLTGPKVTHGLPEESRVTLKVPADGDLRPVTVRYRAVAERRFPGSGARVHAFTFPLVQPESADRPAFHGSVRVGGLKLRIGPQRRFTFSVRARPRGTPFGYDLQVLQGGALVSRLRVTGRCKRVAGLVTCRRGKVRLT
jgi:hypothetical protein